MAPSLLPRPPPVPTTTRGPSLWRFVSHHDWLQRKLLACYEDNSDEVSVLYLLALDAGQGDLRKYLEQHCALSVDHVRRLAMVHSMWSALLQLTRGRRAERRTKNLRLSEVTVDHISRELHALHIPLHPDRRQALLTAVSSEHQQVSPVFCSKCDSRHADRGCYGAYACSGGGQHHGPHHCGGTQFYMLCAAATHGNLESVVWLHYLVCYDQEIALEKAAKQGHDHVVAWLLDHAHSTIIVDSRYEDDPELGILAWRTSTNKTHYTLTKKWGCQSSYARYEPATAAARCGDIDGLRQLHGHALFGSGFTASTAIAAASSGHLPILAFLLEHYRHVFEDTSILTSAVQHDRLEVVQWLVATGCVTITSGSLWTTTQHQRLEILQWMLSIIDDRTSAEHSIASTWRGGHRILEWLVRDRGCEPGSIPYANAAALCKDTELVKFAVARRMETGAFSNDDLLRLFPAACSAGNFELVRWLVDDLHLWSPHVFYYASKGLCAKTLGFLYEAAQARSESTNMASREHGPYGLETLVWALRHGFTTSFLGPEALSTTMADEREYASQQYKLGYYPSSYYSSPTEMQRLREAIGLVIQLYDPHYVRRLLWLPTWATRYGTLESLERLATIGHEKLFTRKLFDRLLVASVRPSVVQWFLEQRPELFTTLVVRWAATYDKPDLLAWLFQTFLPAHADVLLWRKCVRTALWTLARYERHKTMVQLQEWTPLAREPSMWVGIAQTTTM